MDNISHGIKACLLQFTFLPIGEALKRLLSQYANELETNNVTYFHLFKGLATNSNTTYNKNKEYVNTRRTIMVKSGTNIGQLELVRTTTLH